MCKIRRKIMKQAWQNGVLLKKYLKKSMMEHMSEKLGNTI